MAREINQRDLRNDSGAILRAAEQGETFIVTRNGTPVAELRALPVRRTFVNTAEAIKAMGHMPPVDYQKMREQLDEIIDQDPFRE